MALIRNAYMTHYRSPRVFCTTVLQTGSKWSFLDTNFAIKWARWLEITQNLLHMIRNLLYSGFEPQCAHK